MKKHLILLLILISSLTTKAQVRYWIFFTDKQQSIQKLDNPKSFLSEKAIERRVKQNIEINESDLPVSNDYIQELKSNGIAVLQKSKWLNGVSVFATKSQIKNIKNLSFVQHVQPVMRLEKNAADKGLDEAVYLSEKQAVETYSYGQSTGQVFMLNGQYLHNEGSKGEGMLIAVLDGGFTGVDKLEPFDYLWERNGIVATYDFVDNDTDVFHVGSHGMSVLSVMAALVDGQLIGTGLNANYLLLKSEDQASESAIEEDNWVAAAEFADSAGADIINSSLGYSTFDGGLGDYTQDDLDGRTTTTAKAAVMAARKGILVVNSAGNEGSASWKKLLTPADADSILAVGGVNAQREYVAFSSTGPSADGRIKPDIAAQAASVYLSTFTGNVGPGNGTSFAAPLISGLAACLWQRHPGATNMEIRAAIMKSASQFNSPDTLLGYGIPDFYLADYYLSNPQVPQPEPDDDVTLMPNPFTDELTLYMRLEQYPTQVSMNVFDVNGNLVKNEKIEVYSKYTSLQGFSFLAQGAYIFRLDFNGTTKEIKMIH